MENPDIERLAEGLRKHTAAFAAAIGGVDPGRPVPTCPQWRVRDLVGHIGQAHRWAAGIARTGEFGGVPDPREADPGDPREWAGWLSDGAEELIAAVLGADPGAAVWTYLGPRPAAFWLRRMLHDTCVHHADAGFTAATAFRVAPDLAAGAISEALELLCAPGAETLKPALAELRGNGETLRLSPTERSERGWLITRTPLGARWERGRPRRRTWW
ncbi:maleylpyruvate isomerase family mycothiol-dependent enzyme [Streptomyces capparidis]